MDIRNLQKTGGQSYIITLPKNWVVTNSLKDKDKVKVFNHKHHLVIVPFSYKKTEKYPVCNIDSMTKQQISREIIGYYLSGTENIVVKAHSLTYEQRAAVRQISYQLIGCECLESSTNQMLLKNVSNNINHVMPEYVEKMISIITSMFQDSLLYLEKGDEKMAIDIIERDVEPDRLHLAIIRSHNIRLNKIEVENTECLSLLDSRYYEQVAFHLERIADHIVRIAEYYLIIDKKKNRVYYTPSEKTILKNTLNNLFFCKAMMSSFDKSKAHQYLDIFNTFVNLKTTSKYNNREFINLITAESISRINHYIANIAEEIINHINIKLSLG